MVDSFVIMALIGLVNIGTLLLVTFPPVAPLPQKDQNPTPTPARVSTLAPILGSDSYEGVITRAMPTSSSSRKQSFPRESEPESASELESEPESATGSKTDTYTNTDICTKAQAHAQERVQVREFERARAKTRPRQTWAIVTQRQFILSCTIATVAHTVMTMVMSNCSIAMNDRGFSFSDQSWVMMAHFLAMFSPGFVTGSLIEKQGPFTVSVLGGFVFAASSVVFVVGEEYWNFIGGK